MVSHLVTITGPIASGKNTVATLVARRCTEADRSVVIVDVDDVAAMVAGPGAGASGLWFAAHRAHGALVAAWLATEVDLVVSVGPIYSEDEQQALFGALPADADAAVLRVLIDASLAVTWARVQDDQDRGLSRERQFHVAAHQRFRSLRAGIPADLVFESGVRDATAIAAAIVDALTSGDGNLLALPRVAQRRAGDQIGQTAPTGGEEDEDR